MNTLRNKVQLIGRLGQDPEIITFDDGTKMAKFSMATDDSYKDKKGDKVERTYWHHVVDHLRHQFGGSIALACWLP